MRILHCIATMDAGGAERQLTYLVEEQMHRGHDVHIALLREGANSERLRHSKANVHVLRHRSSRDPMIVLRIGRLIRRLRPQIVQSWLQQMDVIAGIATIFSGAAWIATERSSASAYPPSFWSRVRVLLARRAALVIANSAGGADYWRSVAPRVTVEVIPNAVPFDDLRATAALPRGDARPTIVYAGRLSTEKNVETILAAMSRPQLAGARLVICGDGPLHGALEQSARELGITDRVTFAGYVCPLAPTLRSADAFVSASFFEGHPNAVLEALACEVPLALSDIPAHREFLNDICARFFDPHDPDAAARALSAAIRRDGDEHARVAAARLAIHDLDPASVAARYDAAYERVTAHP